MATSTKSKSKPAAKEWELRAADISTVHMPGPLAKLLNAAGYHRNSLNDLVWEGDVLPGFSTSPFVFGWILRVHDEFFQIQTDTWECKEEICKLWRWCTTNDIKLLKMDCDGPVVDDLPSYDWG